MTNEEYCKASEMVIYIAGCVVNNKVPDKERIETVKLQDLYAAADRHMLSAITGFGLEAAGITDDRFVQARAKALRKVAAMEIDKEELFARFEEEGIWYMPLKGSVIKDMYPAFGIRQMSDFDILFDAAYAERVREIMLSLGFTCESYGKHHHDEYHKPPVSNFEMHNTLFNISVKKEIYDEYINIKDRLQKDEGNSFGYHFSDNDMYLYLTAHEYKHFQGSGTGLRSLLDTYVVLSGLGDRIDFGYIEAKTKKLGIDEFEQKNRALAMRVFKDDTLSSDEQTLLEYYIFSGTYGTTENRLSNSVARNGGGSKGKRRFLLKKLFPPMNVIREWYPTFYKYRILLPFFPVYKIAEALTVKRNNTRKKIRILKKMK